MKGTRLMLVNGISVTVTGLEDMSKKEIIGYIQMLQQENNGDLAKLSISPAEDGEINRINSDSSRMQEMYGSK